MKHFQDSENGKIYSFQDDVQVTSTHGVYSFATKNGSSLKKLPATLKPYTLPPPAPPTLAQLAQKAITAGLQVRSASTPALDATYPMTGEVWLSLKDEAAFITSFGCFSSDAPEWDIALNTSRTITFTQTEQVKEIVKVICIRLHALKKISATNQGTIPSLTATIP